jgi:replicative DNA helicase
VPAGAFLPADPVVKLRSPLVQCPSCGNQVKQDEACPFCAYADSVGIPTDVLGTRGGEDDGGSEARLQVNYDLSILNAFIDNKFLLQKAIEQGFVPEMLELNLAQKLARHMISLYETEPKAEAWDKFIVRVKLKQRGVLTVTLDQFYSKVVDVPVPTMEHLLTYLDLLKSQFSLRSLNELGEDLRRFSHSSRSENREKIEQFCKESIDKLHAVQRMGVSKRVSQVKYQIEEIVHDIQERERTGTKEIIGYSIAPFHTLNRTWSGLRNGFLYAIAGAPRRGKTNLVLDLATYLARENKIPVLFFTWEQTKKNLTYRLLAKESLLNPDNLQRKQLLKDPIARSKLQAGLRRMSDYQDWLYVIEATKDVSVETVRGHAYNVMQEFDTDKIAIFIDYIQKMPPSNHGQSNEKMKVEEISTELKGLSIELNCPVVAISSLNKEGCTIDHADNESRPSMYHCKGSGDIEYDLDSAAILSKDWGDTHELFAQLGHMADALGKDPMRLPKVDIVNLHIDKNRDVPEGVPDCIQFLFFIEENKFIEIGAKDGNDPYRFKRVEDLVKTLVDKDFIRFHDHEEVVRKSAGDRMDEQRGKTGGATGASSVPGMPPGTPIPGMPPGTPAPSGKTAGRKETTQNRPKIRLKY